MEIYEDHFVPRTFKGFKRLPRLMGLLGRLPWLGHKIKVRYGEWGYSLYIIEGHKVICHPSDAERLRKEL
jgi:hypothetical protein